jgi:hypothetical protein
LRRPIDRGVSDRRRDNRGSHPRRQREAPSHGGDALATVMKVKKLAEEVGGLKKLKALVDALTE